MSRVSAAFRMGLREYRRTPLLLVLLVGLPVYIIGMFSVIIPTAEISLQFAGGANVTASIASITVTFMTPLTGVFIGGLTGMVVMQMTSKADERLVLAGYRPYQVVLARLLFIGFIGVLVTVAATTMLLLTGFVPDHLGWFTLATLLATLVYGMVGIIVGIVLDTLPGIYFMLLAPMISGFLFQNPVVNETGVWAAIALYLPAHFPLKLAMSAAYTESVDARILVWSLFVLVVWIGLATAAYYRSLHATE